MHLRTLLAVAAAPVAVLATLDKAESNSKGMYPSSVSCAASKVSRAIQAAECAYNTRAADQTFAVFETDHQYDGVQGAPYGTCSAYTCDPPGGSEMVSGSDYWTFFWSSDGASIGVGTNCIKDPSSGVCGCENSDGTFIPGSSSCV